MLYTRKALYNHRYKAVAISCFSCIVLQCNELKLVIVRIMETVSEKADVAK